MQALQTVRGNQRVTSDNPEATYDSLGKYAQDLVVPGAGLRNWAGHWKGYEIRNIVRILSVRQRTIRY